MLVEYYFNVLVEMVLAQQVYDIRYMMCKITHFLITLFVGKKKKLKFIVSH